MNKLNIYVVRDEVAQDNTFICTAKNDEECRNNVKLALCSSTQNFINTHTKDKRVVLVGSIDINTGVITPEASPILLFTVEEVRLQLVEEITLNKSRTISKFLKNGIGKADVKGLYDLVRSTYSDLDIDKDIINDFKQSKEFNDLVNSKVAAIVEMYEKVGGNKDGN